MTAMDEEEIEIVVVPPGRRPEVYSTAVPPECSCEWKRDGLGVDGSVNLPAGAVATWYTITRYDQGCRFHGRLEDT